MRTFTLLLFVIIAQLNFTSCTKNKPVAEVGSTSITKKDVEMRLKVMSVFSSQPDEKIALEQLIRSYTIAEVLKNKGLTKLNDEITRESKRLSESAKTNPKMGEIQKVFARDTESFNKVFVLPMLVDRLAYTDGYLKDETFHQPKKDKAEQFLNETKKTPDAFELLAKQRGFAYKTGTVEPIKGLIWDKDKETKSVSLPTGAFVAQQWKKSALDSTPSGKISDSLIDQGNFWVAIKNLGPSPKDKNIQKIAVAVIFREPFGAWLEKNRAEIKVNRLAEAQSKKPTSKEKTNN